MEDGWGARKVQAELEKLGFRALLATVSRYLPMSRPTDTQLQRRTTFLRNRRKAIAAMDFLVVPTVRFKLLYVWFVIEHDRRQVLRVNVTAHPTSSWTIQQLREAFPHETSTRFKIHDNGTIFPDRIAEAKSAIAPVGPPLGRIGLGQSCPDRPRFSRSEGMGRAFLVQARPARSTSGAKRGSQVLLAAFVARRAGCVLTRYFGQRSSSAQLFPRSR